jgi:hypothetical protein
MFVNPRQKHRNTTAGLATKYGQEGEVCVDTDKKTAVIMDGVTQGGFPLAREDFSNVSEITDDTYVQMDVGTITPDPISPIDNETLGLLGWIKKLAANIKYKNDYGKMFTCSTASYDATLTGTVSATYASTTITGSGTLFTTELAVGDTIVINGTPSLITNIASNTSLTVALGGYTNTTITGATAYKANDNKTVDLTGVTVSAGTMISVKFDNKNYGFSLKINGDTVVSSDGGSYAGRYFLPAGYHIRFIRNSTNTAWIIVNEIIYTGSGSTQDYSLRADGWVEQSGFINNLTATTLDVILPKQMINIDYKLTHGHYVDSTTAQILFIRDFPSTTTIKLKSGNSTITRAWWEVKGYAA